MLTNHIIFGLRDAGKWDRTSVPEMAFVGKDVIKILDCKGSNVRSCRQQQEGTEIFWFAANKHNKEYVCGFARILCI